jgi:hypothetical protein
VDNLEANIGTPTDLGGGATISANLVQTEAFADNLPTDPADASDIAALFALVESGISWNAAWDAEVESEANDALVAIHLDHLLAVTYDPASEPVADSLLGDLTESDAGVTRFTTNSLEQGPAGGGGGGATAAEVWEYEIETGVSAECAEAVKLAQATGNYSTVGSVRTFYAPDGITVRAIGTVSTNGLTRTATDITCP